MALGGFTLSHTLDSVNGGTTTTERFTYDDAGREATHRVTKGGISGDIWRQETGYNNNGDVSSSITTVGTTRTSDAVTYDHAGRLDVLTRVWDPDTATASNESTAIVDYGWNVRGDRNAANATLSGPSTGMVTPAALGIPGFGNNTWTYSVGGRLIGSSKNTNYTYDADSRLTVEDRSGTTDTRYTYDNFGDLSRVETRPNQSTPWSTSTQWTRDALGRPTQLASGGTTRSYVHAGLDLEPIATTTGGATTTLVRTPQGQLVGASDATGAHRVFVNNHGDIAATLPTAPGANLTSSTIYGPFGTPTTTGTNATGLGYQSQPQDQATLIVDTATRAYDPVNARFLQADTWDGDNTNPITLNHYTYANASPYTMSDPTGMFGISSFMDKAKNAIASERKSQKQRHAHKAAYVERRQAKVLRQDFLSYSGNAAAVDDWEWAHQGDGDLADLNPLQQGMVWCAGNSTERTAERRTQDFRSCVGHYTENAPYWQAVMEQDAPRTGGGVCDSQFARIVDRGDTCETLAAAANGVDDVREGIQDTITDPLAIPRAINTGYNEDGLYGALAAGAEVVVTPIITAGDCLINSDNMERIRCGSAIATGIAVGLATGPVASKLTGSSRAPATSGGAPRWGGRLQGDRGAIDWSGGRAQQLDDSLAIARNQRDDLAAAMRGGRDEPGAFTGAVSRSDTSRIAAACSGGGQCAEPNAVSILGIDPSDAQFTHATGWRQGSYGEIPVCVRCQEVFDPDQFPPGVQFDAGGRWSDL